MSLDEGNVDAALYSALDVSGVTSIATGGIHSGRAPQGTATPFLRFRRADGPPDQRTFGSPRIVRHRYLLQAVDDGFDGSVAEDLLAAADAVLDDQTLTVTGATAFLECRRERRVSDLVDEVPGGVVYQIRGAYYGVEVQA